MVKDLRKFNINKDPHYDVSTSPEKKKARRSNSCSSNNIMDELLPQEIIFNIFSRLSVKTLKKLKCVSKSWCKIIDDPCLGLMQIHNSERKSNEIPLIVPELKISRNVVTFHTACENEKGKMISAGKSTTVKIEVRGYCGRGSCNGLVYFAEDRQGGIVVVVNPLGGSHDFRVLPTMNVKCGYMKTYGLGFDSSTKSFKMVCTFFRDLSYNVGAVVHTLGTNSWKEITKVPRYPISGNPVFVHGFLHWMVSPFWDLDGMIVSFDVCKEEFDMIPYPEFRSNDKSLFKLFDLDGDLAMVDLSCDDNIDIWVMNYQKKVWRKEYSFWMPARDGEVDNGKTEVIGTWKDGEILLKSRLGYLMYNTKSGELKYKQVSGFDSNAQVYSHRGSLISSSDAIEF